MNIFDNNRILFILFAVIEGTIPIHHNILAAKNISTALYFLLVILIEFFLF